MTMTATLDTAAPFLRQILDDYRWDTIPILADWLEERGECSWARQLRGRYRKFMVKHGLAPRLVFADWLEERGDPWGEFLRVGVELARLDEVAAKAEAGAFGQGHEVRRLAKRHVELLARHGEAWARALWRAFATRAGGEILPELP